jgi:hypothetical protein
LIDPLVNSLIVHTPSTQEGFDRLRIARMTPDGTFELDEPAEGEASQAGGRARQRESR